MAQKGRGIFMVYVDIDDQHAREFNKWYNQEHLPELLSVPGILSAARYEAVKGGPKYLACYELESVAVMRTPAFTNRPRTPWGQKVSPSVIGNEFDPHCRGTDLPGRRGNAGARHGAGVADRPHVRPRRPRTLRWSGVTPFALHLNARSPAPPNWSYVTYLVFPRGDFCPRLPSPYHAALTAPRPGGRHYRPLSPAVV